MWVIIHLPAISSSPPHPPQARLPSRKSLSMLLGSNLHGDGFFENELKAPLPASRPSSITPLFNQNRFPLAVHKSTFSFQSSRDSFLHPDTRLLPFTWSSKEISIENNTQTERPMALWLCGQLRVHFKLISKTFWFQFFFSIKITIIIF